MKRFLYTLKYIFTLPTVAFLTMALPSCAGEEINDPSLDTAPDGCVTVTVSIPPASFGSSLSSRAEYTDPIDNDQMAEGSLKELYLVIYKEDPDYPGTYNLYRAPNIIDAANITNLQSSYANDYKLYLTEGKYKFYLLANLYDYWKNGAPANANTEADYEKVFAKELNLEYLRLTFTQAYIDYLPMACLAREICTYDESTQTYTPIENGIFEVTQDDINDNKSISLYAPMSILCSKVRYTVLFDNTEDTSFSGKFPLADIHLTPVGEDGTGNLSGNVTIHNLHRVSPLYPLSDNFTPDNSDKSNWINSWINSWVDYITRNILQAEYPKENANPTIPSGAEGDASNVNIYVGTEGYLDIEHAFEKFNASPDYLQAFGNGYEDSWNPETQRAWQSEADGQTGSIYLPENPEIISGPVDEADSKVTYLHLNVTGTGVKSGGYDIKIPDMKRGYFYDIVAKLVESNAFKVEIYVSVNPWQYKPQAPLQW